MILDTCPMLKEIKIRQLDKDPDFIGTVLVNLDRLQQLGSIFISSDKYSRIKIVSKKDINTKLKKISGRFTIQENLLLLAL